MTTDKFVKNALLAGLLLCQNCQRPMVPTYTAKPGRRYRYCVCQAARQNGWGSCPTKSVAAHMIESAVLDQLYKASGVPETREQLDVSEADWQIFEQDPAERSAARSAFPLYVERSRCPP